MVDYAAVLTRKYPDCLWSLNGNDYSGLSWDGSNAVQKPTKASLEAAWDAVRDDLAWDAVRAERDSLLAACDWTQVADAPVDAAAWATYRQALRDIPQDYASPDDVVWPEAP